MTYPTATSARSNGKPQHFPVSCHVSAPWTKWEAENICCRKDHKPIRPKEPQPLVSSMQCQLRMIRRRTGGTSYSHRVVRSLVCHDLCRLDFPYQLRSVKQRKRDALASR